MDEVSWALVVLAFFGALVVLWREAGRRYRKQQDHDHVIYMQQLAAAYAKIPAFSTGADAACHACGQGQVAAVYCNTADHILFSAWFSEQLGHVHRNCPCGFSGRIEKMQVPPVLKPPVSVPGALSEPERQRGELSLTDGDTAPQVRGPGVAVSRQRRAKGAK